MLPLQILVSQRNDLVHNYSVNKFQSKSSKRQFVNVSNAVLIRLKESAALSVNRYRYENSQGRVSRKIPSASNTSQITEDTELYEEVQGGAIPEISTKPAMSGMDSESRRVRLRPCSGGVFSLQMVKDEIKAPRNHTLNTKESLKFHCWNMIRMDPRLQKQISEDVDGLFEGLLPMNLEEYISKVPE